MFELTTNTLQKYPYTYASISSFTGVPQGSFYVLTSFDERPLKVVKSLDAGADLMLISGSPCSEKVVARAQALGVKRIGCAMDGTSRAAVREAQKAGLRRHRLAGT